MEQRLKPLRSLTPFIVGLLLIALPTSQSYAGFFTSISLADPEPQPVPEPTPNTGQSGEFVSSTQLYTINVVCAGALSENTIQWVIADATAMNGGTTPTILNVFPNTPQQDIDDLHDLLLIQPSDQPPPTDDRGRPLPPPVVLKPVNGVPNEWVPATPSGPRSRPTVYKPKINYPGTGGGQPRASWDPDGHWDVNNGLGDPRIHIKPDGTTVDGNDVIIPAQDFNWPDPFEGVDWETAQLYAALGLTGALLLIIGASIWYIIGAGSGLMI